MIGSTKNTGAVIKETKDFMVVSKQKLFFKVNKKSILTAFKPILEFNNPMHRSAFDEWCNEHAAWADCPFSDFCQRVQRELGFKKGGACFKCQVISDKLYQDKGFVNFVNVYSAKNDAFLAREINSGKLAYLGNINPAMNLFLIEISPDDSQLVAFEPDNGWPVLDKNLKVIDRDRKEHAEIPHEELKPDNEKNSDDSEKNSQTGDLVPQFLSTDNKKEGALASVETGIGKNKSDDGQGFSALIITETVDKDDKKDTQAENPGFSEQSLSKDSVKDDSNSKKIKSGDLVLSEDHVSPSSVADDAADNGGEKNNHDTRSFFYLRFKDGEKTELQRMKVCEACIWALKMAKEKEEYAELFKSTKRCEKSIKWEKHPSVFKEELPEFIKENKPKDAISGKNVSSDIKNPPLHGARYFRLEWPGGSLGPTQMFIPNACEMAFKKANEIGDHGKVHLFKVTLKNGAEEEVNWSKNKPKQSLGPKKKTDKSKKDSVSTSSHSEDVSESGEKREGKNINISGNFSFSFDINVNIN